MQTLFSATIFPCERLLIERDDVFGAIRLADVFFWNPDQSSVPEDERQKFVFINWYCYIRRLDGAKTNHKIKLLMVRPNGEETDLTGEIESEFTSQYDDVFPSVIMPLQMKLKPQELGRYQLVIFVDGEEIARSFVTLVLPPALRVS